ncbi:MAG: carboxypeptidase regulatory-like domain-containing protein [Planctomycetes bacterium]|nr:carboxypeptidase regulatory-like domain-containing protein [Planctomycetota bacterium]
MSRRSLLALLGLALVAALVLISRSLDDDAAARAGRALAGPAEVAPHDAASARELAQAPTEDAAPARNEVATAPAPTRAPAAAFAPSDDALWVAGRVVFPDRTPSDERLVLEARGRRFGDADGPREHRVEVAHDGRFRVAFAPKTTKGWLRLEGRWLYLDEPLRLVPEDAGEVVLEPHLGGVVRGTCAPPPGYAAEAQTFADAVVEISRWEGNRNVHLSAALAEDGSFELSALPPGGGYDLQVRAPAFQDAWEHDVVVTPGRATEFQLALALGAHVAGRVVDPSGAPLEGAAVHLIQEGGAGGFYNSSMTTTGADGAFEFRGTAAGASSLRVLADGLAVQSLSLGELREGERRDDLTVTLRAGLELRGKVTWPDGTPAGDVSVTAKARQDQARLDAADNDPELSVLGYYDDREVSAQTDAEGAFVLRGLGARRVDVEASGRQPLADAPEEGARRRPKRGPLLTALLEDVAPGAGGLHLVLGEGEALVGSVRFEDGAPATRYSLEVRPDWNVQDGLEWSDGKTVGVRDDEGRFEVRGLRSGAWSVSVRGKDFVAEDVARFKIPHAGPLDLVVRRAAALSGVVVTPGGEPVAGATLTVIRNVGNASHWDESGERTDAEGAFELRRLEPADYELFARAAGWAQSARASVQLAPGETRTDLRLVLRAGGRLTGVVLPAAGRVDGRRVTAWGGEARVHESRVTDDAGAFEFDGLAEGHYDVTLEPASEDGDETDWQIARANRTSATAEVVAGGTTHVELGAPPAQPIRVFGVVRSGGAGVAGYVVHFAGGLHRSEAATRTDEQGGYALEVDGAGSYAVTLRPGDSAFGVNYQVRRVEVGGVAEQREDFELATAALDVVVTARGAAARQVPLSLEALDVEGLANNVVAEQLSDEAGRFRFRHLEPGTYLLRCGGGLPWQEDQEAWALQVSEVRVAEGDVAEVAVALEPGASLSGTARFADGGPTGGYMVEVLDAAGRRVSTSWNHTTPSGSFTVSGLPSGKLTVQVKGPDGAGEATVRTSVGAEAQVDVTVSR